MTLSARLALAAILAALLPVVAPRAQTPGAPVRYEILSLDVEGASSEATETFVVQTSGLDVGDEVTIPGDENLGNAVRKLYRLGLFSDVEIVADRFAGTGVFLLIRVVEEPRLGEFTLEGISSGERADLNDQLPLLRGRAVRPADVERSRQIIQDYFAAKGYRLATVAAARETNEEGRVELTFTVAKGERVEVAEIRFSGNSVFSDRTLRRRLKNTPERRWWRFWSRETFDATEFAEDRRSLLAFYGERGYYGARIVRDSAYLAPPSGGGRPGVVVDIELEEGPKYHVRHVTFEGNTEYTDAQLAEALGFVRGDVFNAARMDQNLYYTAEHTDVASLYTDRGYLRFNIVPTITEAPGDSLDLAFEIEEGDVYEFGQVAIAGNTRTKDHVIRRELRTIPGQTYSRQSLERSVRELIQLNYFDQASLASGPAVRVNDADQTVDLTYNLTEAGSDQLELSGGWGGQSGLLLQAGVTFNNFSIQNLFRPEAYRPLPMGDGQQLSLRVTTSGARYQNYAVSFTEPWFRGRQTPAGLSLGYSRVGRDSSSFSSGYGRLFYRQRLKWPDDFFQTGTDLGYRSYNLNGEAISSRYGLPEGISRELTIRQSLTRNSLDNPIFPQAGSSFAFSVEVAPPLPGFLQYHKWLLNNAWYAPLTGRLSVNVRADFGYVGSLTGDEVAFQRFLLGGSPLEAQGDFVGVGKDLVFLRGYPIRTISPRQNGQPVGGRIFNKYSAELQFLAIQTPQLQAAPYLFFDAGNAWSGFEDYNPGQLYRSAGVGARVFLPILGLVDVNYGYGLDPVYTPSGDALLPPQWRFQFSLGGGQ